MRFLAGHWLFLLIGIAGLAAAYLWVQVRGRRRAAVRFTNLELLASVAPQRPGWQRHVPAVLLLLAMTAMVVALARPTRSVRVARQRAIVVMAVDVSLSMEATDVEPSRPGSTAVGPPTWRARFGKPLASPAGGDWSPSSATSSRR